MSAEAPVHAEPGVQADAETGCGLLLLRLARAAGYHFGRALERLGIRSHHFAVLHQLDAAGPSSQQAIGQALRVHPSNLVRLLDELEAAGLVVRGVDPRDRRRYLLELTPAGRRVLERARSAVEAAERDLLAPLSTGERRELQAMLARMSWHACQGKAGARC
jgi:MarR family transcriptional regulator, lower aerobic nicotinate degradation pathway regulator